MPQQLWMYQPYDVKRDIWTREEIARMIIAMKRSRCYLNNIHGDWMRARDMLIFVMMYEEGCRPKEITSIKFSDINFNEMKLFINGENNKTKSSRYIPISNKIALAFNEYIAFPKWIWNNSKYLFPSFENKSRPLSSERWKHIFREKICKPAGLWKRPSQPNKSRTSSYSLRHSRATELLEKTGDIELVANFLGHKDIRITRAYLHLTKTRWNQMNRMIND